MKLNWKFFLLILIFSSCFLSAQSGENTSLSEKNSLIPLTQRNDHLLPFNHTYVLANLEFSLIDDFVNGVLPHTTEFDCSLFLHLSEKIVLFMTVEADEIGV